MLFFSIVCAVIMSIPSALHAVTEQERLKASLFNVAKTKTNVGLPAMAFRKHLASDEVKLSIDEVDFLDDQNRTPLHWAAENGMSGFVQVLVEEGADTQLIDSKGDTPLDLAWKKKHLGTLAELALASGRYQIMLTGVFSTVGLLSGLFMGWLFIVSSDAQSEEYWQRHPHEKKVWHFGSAATAAQEQANNQ